MSGGVPLIQNPANIITDTGTTSDQHTSNQAIKKNFDDLNSNAVGVKELKDQLNDYKEIDLLPVDDSSYQVLPTDLGRLIEVDVTGGAKTVLMPLPADINMGFTFAVIDDIGNMDVTKTLTVNASGEKILITNSTGVLTEVLNVANSYRRYYWNGLFWKIIGKVN